MRLLCIPLLVVLAAPTPGLSQPGPVCANPDVLDRIARIIATSGSTGRMENGAIEFGAIDLSLVRQVPSAQPNTVACAVGLVGWTYDTGRYGSVPRRWERTYSFTVRRGRNALFVELLGAG